MKSQIINFKELQDWHLKEKCTYAISTTKRMDFYLNGGIEIYTKEKKQSWSESILHWQGIQLFTAVEVYNELV